MLVKSKTRLPVLIIHQRQPIINDIGCIDLEEMIFKIVKHVRVKLEHLLGHAIKQHPTYLPCQHHLEDVKEDGHAGSNIRDSIKFSRRKMKRKNLSIEMILKGSAFLIQILHLWLLEHLFQCK